MHSILEFSGEYSASSTSKLGKSLMICFFFDKEISYDMLISVFIDDLKELMKLARTKNKR